MSELVLGSGLPGHAAPELERRMLLQAMGRVYDHERAGRITSAEREQLLAKYRAQLEQLPFFGFGAEAGAIGKDMIKMLDQRFAQLSAKIEDLRYSMVNAPSRNSVPARMEVVPEKREPKMEEFRKAEAHTPPARTETLPPVDSIEGAEADGGLEDIKKQIMQTLSRLEQAEVE